eukprot:gene10325-2466_t
MDLILEKQRQLHEEIDRLVKDGAATVQYKFPTAKSKTNAQHLQRLLAERVSECSSELLDLYADVDGNKKKEVDGLSVNSINAFYKKLGEIKEYHKDAPNDIARPPRTDILPEFLQPEARLQGTQQTSDSKKKSKDNKEEKAQTLMGFVEFTGEECGGRCLDLHEHYTRYGNLKGAPRMDYLEYIQAFDNLSAVPRTVKKTSSYKIYINTLCSYLIDFYYRAFPLVDLDAELEQANKDFEKLWYSGRFRGWLDVKSVETPTPVGLDQFSSAKQLEELGMDRLKSALMAEGLKCGGTLEQRAQRLFSIKGLPREKWDKAIVAKGLKKEETPDAKLENGNANNGHIQKDEKKSLAEIEARILVLAKLLSTVREATKENVERKMARGVEEPEEEEDLPDLDDDADSDEDEDGDLKVGKRNALVLGPDGKPIPYWLYRLHGLNIIYTCEICGNYPYRGPKHFQQHFTEWRHAQGMRALGIPNTKHFANVTNINDAKVLWNRLQQQKNKERFEPDQEEEYEDSMGNVVNKKTYNDLLRQGLL